MSPLKQYLLDLADRKVEPIDPKEGICCQLHIAGFFNISAAVDFVALHSQKWPHYSGCPGWPVPGEGSPWADDAYGDARRDLCRFLAGCIE